MPDKFIILSIRNMVCDRCIRVVRDELRQLGLDVRHVELGEVHIGQGAHPVDRDLIARALERNGFELIEDRRRKLIEAVRHSIISLLRRNEPLPSRFRLSRYISQHVSEEYASLSALFSSVEGTTIEHFFILQKIERVKELLKYDEKPLKEIAWDLGYSSTQHLSNQFKQVTGLTPTQFRTLGTSQRTPLDRVQSRRNSSPN